MTFRVDEAPDPATFIAGHRSSFGGTMDRAEFAWWFRREAGGPPADVFVYLDGDVPAAGSAVSYRRLASGEAVAVMTSSWTAPAYRRRGLFRDVIARSRDLAERRGAHALLGFVTGARPSVPPLEAASELVADAWVLAGSDDARPEAAPPPPDLCAWFHRHRFGAHLAYDEDVFRDQLRLDLPGTEVRRVGESSWGVCRGGMLLAAISERPWEPAEAAGTVARSGLAAYTTVREIAEGRPATAARVFVIAVRRPVPDALRGPLDLQAADRA